MPSYSACGAGGGEKKPVLDLLVTFSFTNTRPAMCQVLPVVKTANMNSFHFLIDCMKWVFYYSHFMREESEAQKS